MINSNKCFNIFILYYSF